MVRTGSAMLLAVCLAAVVRADDAAGTEDAVPRPEPIEAPSAADIEGAITHGIDFLMDDQNANGSWGNATRTKELNIYAPVPGAHDAFRTAVTAMCIMTLIESGSERADVLTSLDRAETWFLENLAQVRRATPDAMYNVWTHCYAIQALVRMDSRTQDESRKARIRELIDLQFDRLTAYESVDGGWGYYDFRYGTKQPTSSSISFVNAAVLVAFHEAKIAGFHPPQRLVDRAVAAIHRQQLPDFSYLYGEYLHWSPRLDVNRPGGSLGRSQACNLALRLWGDEEITDQVLIDWLDRLIARNGWLDIGRKRPVPHESWFQVAGYFYYFGHYYAALLLNELPEEVRPQYRAHLARLMLDRQERDGSWWDYPLYDYHQPYGTSFAVMTLLHCREAVKAGSDTDGR